MEANFAGMSFLTLDKLGKLRYASDIVNVVADARLEHGPGLGTFGYDDEGVPAQCTDIIKDGLFTGYLTNRETAAAIGLARSGGTMRAESWNRLPIIRMTNVSLLPGTWNYDDLIADTDDAILMETNRSWSIDDRRYHFQFSTEIGWEIKGGKKGRMIKNPSYSGITTEFWNSCDAICSRDHWTLWGTPNCGKGQPMQTMGTGHGASPSRFRNVRVGVALSQVMSPARKSAASPRSAPPDRAGVRPAVAEAHLPSDAELRRIAERILKLSDADETEVEIEAGADALTRFANNTIHQNVAEQTLSVSVRTVFDGRTARATTNKTDDESLRRVVAASATLARSQPKNPDLLPMPGQQKYAKVERYFASTAAATPVDRAHAVARVVRPRREEPTDRRGHFLHRRLRDGPGEFARPVRRAPPDSRRIFRHHAGQRLLRLGQGQFARSAQPRSRGAGRNRQPEGRGLAQSARSRAGPLDRDSRALRRSRSGRLPLLRFCRHGHSRPALLLQQAHGQEGDGR